MVYRILKSLVKECQAFRWGLEYMTHCCNPEYLNQASYLFQGPPSPYNLQAFQSSLYKSLYNNTFVNVWQTTTKAAQLSYSHKYSPRSHCVYSSPEIRSTCISGAYFLLLASNLFNNQREMK